jgi:RNA polymerase sigma factor (sigma-70 family)
MRPSATTCPSDAELIAATRRGERAAYGQLIARYQDVVWAVSFSSTGDWSLSEDVAQDTFIVAWHQLGQLREVIRLRSWLCGIARNLARKARRRRAREQVVDDDLPALVGSPFEDIARAEADRVVRDALARVPATYREVLVLYYRENQPVREVASTLGISEAAALQRLARGRRHLADGVTDLVERSLRAPRPRTRDIVAGALAVIGAVSAPSRVDASTPKGSTMLLKAALATLAVSATATTAYVVHRQSTSDATAAPIRAGASANIGARLGGASPPTIAKHSPTQVKPTPALAGSSALDVIPKAKLAQLDLDHGPTRGPDDAPVTIIVFQDNMCHFCGKVLGTIDQLWDEYPNKLKLIVKQFPVHDEAKLSAEASFAADAQGKFWPFHDQLLAHQDDLSRHALIEYAQQAGLDVAAFTAALDQHTYAQAVEADFTAGKDAGVTATPEFLINGHRFVGAQPIEEFRTMIDQALAEL